APDCTIQGVGFRDGRLIALGLRHQALFVWDVLSGKRLDNDLNQHASANAVVVRKGQVLTANDDGHVGVWDLRSGRLRASLPPPEGTRFRFVPGPGWERYGTEVFSPDGAYLASGADLLGACVREVHTGEELFNLPNEGEISRFFPAFSPDGKVLAVTRS